MIIIIGAVFNIPIAIWIPEEYTIDAPLVYVDPTDYMIVKPSQNVRSDGKVVVPYLTQWMAVSLYF